MDTFKKYGRKCNYFAKPDFEKLSSINITATNTRLSAMLTEEYTIITAVSSCPAGINKSEQQSNLN